MKHRTVPNWDSLTGNEMLRGIREGALADGRQPCMSEDLIGVLSERQMDYGRLGTKTDSMQSL